MAEELNENRYEILDGGAGLLHIGRVVQGKVFHNLSWKRAEGHPFADKQRKALERACERMNLQLEEALHEARKEQS